MSKISQFIRIIFACIGAFFISSFLSTHYFANPNQFDTIALKNDVDAVITSVTTFHFELPRVTLFSQRTEPSPTPEDPYPAPADNTLLMETASPSSDIPTSTPYIQPTKRVSILPTYSYQPIRMPTNPPLRPTIAQTPIPNPTKPPKPTKAPDVFPVDPSLQRPGTNADEVFTIAAQKSCVPKEILRTLASIESGGFFNVVSPKWFMLYNSYDWWNSPYVEDKTQARIYQRICSGYGYDYGTKLIPDDSKYAGMNCSSDGSTGTRSYIMGPMQMSERLQYNQGPEVAKLLGVKKIDRRVILDAITLAGVVTKINVKAGTCTNWTAAQMVKAACGYYGSCGFKDKTYYCNTFCRNIKEFGGKDCSSAVSQYSDDNCWK